MYCNKIHIKISIDLQGSTHTQRGALCYQILPSSMQTLQFDHQHIDKGMHLIACTLMPMTFLPIIMKLFDKSINVVSEATHCKCGGIMK